MSIAETCMLVDVGLTSSECASWVQAWGSIIAVAVAVFVPYQQRRSAIVEAKNRSSAAAKVAASGVLLTINQILACINFVFDHIEMVAGEVAFDPEGQIGKLDDLRHPSNFELMALIEWAPNCATELAVGSGLIAELRAALAKVSEEWSSRHSIDEKVVVSLLDLLSRAKGHYEKALPLLKAIAL